MLICHSLFVCGMIEFYIYNSTKSLWKIETTIIFFFTLTLAEIIF